MSGPGNRARAWCFDVHRDRIGRQWLGVINDDTGAELFECLGSMPGTEIRHILDHAAQAWGGYPAHFIIDSGLSLDPVRKVAREHGITLKFLNLNGGYRKGCVERAFARLFQRGAVK